MVFQTRESATGTIHIQDGHAHAAVRRRRWLNAFVLAALTWAATDLAAMHLAVEGNRLLAVGLEVAAALLVLRVGYVLFAPEGRGIRRRIAARRGQL